MVFGVMVFVCACGKGGDANNAVASGDAVANKQLLLKTKYNNTRKLFDEKYKICLEKAKGTHVSAAYFLLFDDLVPLLLKHSVSNKEASLFNDYLPGGNVDNTCFWMCSGSYLKSDGTLIVNWLEHKEDLVFKKTQYAADALEKWFENKKKEVLEGKASESFSLKGKYSEQYKNYLRDKEYEDDGIPKKYTDPSNPADSFDPDENKPPTKFDALYKELEELADLFNEAFALAVKVSEFKKESDALGVDLGKPADDNKSEEKGKEK